MHRRSIISFILVLSSSMCFAADPPGAITVIDSAGKEISLKNGRITAGTRKLLWLAQDGKTPEALAFRETDSTGFKDGVLTLIPLDRLERLTYDTANLQVFAKVSGVDKPLKGSIRFREINQVALVAEVDRGAAGIVELTYRGGLVKGGIQSIRFAGTKAGVLPTTKPLYVTIADGKQSLGATAVHDLQALYRIDKGNEKLAPTLMFRKTFKLDLAQVKRLVVREDAETKNFECDVTLKDGTEQTLSLLGSMPLDGKNAILEGLVGTIAAGYKLFPIHTVGEVSLEEPKPGTTKAEDKDAGAAPSPKPKPPTP